MIAIYGILAAGNLLAWGWAVLVFRDHPLLLGTAFLAYSFGLRHAVDADHIAAIDNVTRKLMQEGRRPLTTGFFFSLGHSTVVVLASVAIAATAGALQHRFDALRNVGGVIGTSVSVFFLFAIAIANMTVLTGLYRAFRKARVGEALADGEIDTLLAQRGFYARLLRPCLRLVSTGWHMYPLGFLFGLGFETATEIGLLGLAAAEATKGLSVWSILIFPALFTAGMSLVDTTDSVLMVGAYGWAFTKPLRKLYYNLTVTLISIIVALLIGGVEALHLVAEQFSLDGRFWDGIAALNDHFDSFGCAIIGIFVASWLVSAVIYRLKRYDEAETA